VKSKSWPKYSQTLQVRYGVIVTKSNAVIAFSMADKTWLDKFQLPAKAIFGSMPRA
jgi:hypothetical protein